MKHIINILACSILISSCVNGGDTNKKSKQVNEQENIELEIKENSSNPSFIESSAVDSAKILQQVCKSEFDYNGTSPCNEMDLAIQKVTRLDSILVVESYCSCSSPCLINVLSTHNKKGILIDIVSVYTSCDCPSECEGCGWNNFDIISETTFQITKVTEKITPKYDDEGNELEFDCNVIRDYQYELYKINTNGKMELTESYIKRDNPFLSINSDTTIKLESKLYELNEPIRIVDKKNIIINGNGAILSANSLVSDVIYIENSENITLKNFHATHLDPSGPIGCTGNVIHLEHSKNITIDDCNLNGSGIVGVAAYFVDSLKIKNSIIHENSEYGVIFQGKYIDIENNTFVNNNSGHLYFSYLEKESDYTWPPERLIHKNENIQGLRMSENKFISKPKLH